MNKFRLEFEGDDDPFKEIEEKRMKQCPEMGWYRHEVKDSKYTVMYCIYDGPLECEFRQVIPCAEGAGAYCMVRRKDGIQEPKNGDN